jgi:hypothetical protein
MALLKPAAILEFVVLYSSSAIAPAFSAGLASRVAADGSKSTACVLGGTLSFP